MKVVSTFAGTGGSSLGYKMAGAKVVCAIEMDDHAVESYLENFPDTPVFHTDIAQADIETILSITNLKVGELDVLDGSPPCQGFSSAGKRKMMDTRNQLYHEYIRLLKELKPKAFVMENVSGLIKGNMKFVFSDIMQSLKDAGYRVRCELLNAANYGVPQSRQRLIFIGFREDLAIEPSHPVGSDKVITVREALENLRCEIDPFCKLRGKALKLYSEMVPGENATRAHNKLYGKKSMFNTVKLDFNKPASTITKMVGNQTAAYMHPIEPRLMTIPEIKRLQGFPDNFVLNGKFKERWARIGNSVPPPLMKAVALHIKKILDQYG